MSLDAVTESESRKEVSRRRGDAAFLGRLGKRVRSARARRGLSRKVLAEHAGVSERYLAHLEAGQGNISIILLRNIAAALDIGLADLVCEDPAADPEFDAIVRLLRRAAPRQRRLAREVLSTAQSAERVSARAGRIALIGLRGAGKSTLGKLVAADVGLPFVELNDEIAAVSGLSVAEIFSLYGAEGYRRLERRCLQQVVETQEHVVLACGGGIVTEAQTFDALLSGFFTVWLRAAPEEHMERVRAQGDMRPMGGNPEAMSELKLMLSSREALYARADRQLDTSGRGLEESRRALAALLGREGCFTATDVGDGRVSRRTFGAA